MFRVFENFLKIFWEFLIVTKSTFVITNEDRRAIYTDSPTGS